MRTLHALIAALGLIGCVGDVSDLDTPNPVTPPGPTPTNPTGTDLSAAKAKFDDNVYPILVQKCSNAACHAQAGTGGSVTKFVATSPSQGWDIATGYTALVGNFAASSAPILTLIKPGTHKGIAYVAAEEAKIVEWLDLELSLRNTGGAPPPPTGAETLSQATARVLNAFHGCMQLTDFNAANMPNAWGNMNAGNQQCRDCHANGGEGFVANNQNLFFELLTDRKYLFLQYLTVDLTMGAAMAKVVINKASVEGVANGQDPHREHPRINANNLAAGWTALTTFYNTTMTRVNANPAVCQPSAFPM